MNLGDRLKTGGRGVAGGGLERASIAVQMGMSFALLAAAMLLLQSSLSMGAERLGFEWNHRASVSFTLPRTRYAENSQRVRFFERLEREVAGVDIAGAWAKVKTRVQVLHGEYDADPVVNRAVHELITAMINKASEGSATFREFAGLDHCWTRHPSLEASKDRCGQREQTQLVQDEILSFLAAR